jgi:hypothetical protein
MGDLLHALRDRQPLPRGPYPTATWPEGLTHLQPAAQVASNGQKPERIAAVQAMGAEWLIAFEIDGPHEAQHYQVGTLRSLPARALVDKVKLGGKWFDAAEAVPNYVDAIQEALDAMEWNA